MIKKIGKYMFFIGVAVSLLQIVCIFWTALHWLSFAESILGWVMRFLVMFLGVLLILFGDELKEEH